MAGRMRSRCSPFGYSASGWKFDVVTMLTRLANKRLQQPVQDHRVGDVGDVELVEADQAEAPGDAPAQFVERVDRAAQVLQFAVHLAHELVEVQPRLALQRHRLVEAVHQEALAAADSAVHVDPARNRRPIDHLGQRVATPAQVADAIRSRSAPGHRWPAAALHRRCSRARPACVRTARGRPSAGSEVQRALVHGQRRFLGGFAQATDGHGRCGRCLPSWP